jgi:hypothetical protein
VDAYKGGRPSPIDRLTLQCGYSRGFCEVGDKPSALNRHSGKRDIMATTQQQLTICKTEEAVFLFVPDHLLLRFFRKQ